MRIVTGSLSGGPVVVKKQRNNAVDGLLNRFTPPILPNYAVAHIVDNVIEYQVCDVGRIEERLICCGAEGYRARFDGRPLPFDGT